MEVPQRTARAYLESRSIGELSRDITSHREKPCRVCKHCYNDPLEGYICRKYDGKLTLSSGTTLDWPGQPVSFARSEDQCGAEGRSWTPSIIKNFFFRVGLL